MMQVTTETGLLATLYQRSHYYSEINLIIEGIIIF